MSILIGYSLGDGRYIHFYKCLQCKREKSFVVLQKKFKHKGLCRSCASGKHTRKPIRLKYYIGNGVENSPSITDFCCKHPELGANAKYHFAEVLSGKRLHYKGWFPASKKIRFDLAKVRKVEQTILKFAVMESKPK